MTSLSGTRVVVTRSSEDSDSLAVALEELGAEVIRLPTIAIEIPDELLDAASGVVDDVIGGEYEWIVFSSAAGVRAFAKLIATGSYVDVYGRVMVAAVGAATVSSFRELMGRDVDLVPPQFTGHDLAEALGDGEGRILLPRPVDAPRSIVEELAESGWAPHEVPLYRTVRGEPAPEAIDSVRSGDFDVLTFTSGSTVRFFRDIVGALDVGERRVVVIGPSTEGVATEQGFRVDAVAEPHTTEGVVSAVVGLVGR